MKTMKAGVWAGLCLLIISLVFFVQALAFPYHQAGGGPGPGFFPLWLSGILFVLSVFYIIESFRNKNNHGEEPMPSAKNLKSIVFILSCLILLVILLSVAGFVLSGIIFLFLLLYGSYKWYINAAISIVVTLCVFWLFGTALGVPLPVNLFGW